jgi:hypothetical protein
MAAVRLALGEPLLHVAGAGDATDADYGRPGVEPLADGLA